MSKRAAIYARVSTDDQRGNYSIPTQLAACLQSVQQKRYGLVGNLHVNADTGIDSHPGPDTLPAFVDDFTSRELSRPGLNAALAYLEEAGYDVLVVHALDRLARDPYIRQTLELEFAKRNCKVEYVLGNYEESAEGEVRKDLDATFAKWENLKRVERSTRGKIGKAQRGLFVAGRAPFGYRHDASAVGGLAVEQREADTVRQIFEMYVNEGLSIRRIAEVLTDEGVCTFSGDTCWAKSSVARILGNPVYVGKCYYNKHRRAGKQLVKREHDQWVEFETSPIVDEELFAEAQRRLAENQDLRRREPQRFYMLTGMVFCAECERPYAAQTKKAGTNRLKTDATSYRHRMMEGHCLNRMISGRRLESMVWSEVLAFLLDPTNLGKGYQASLDQQQGARTRGRAQLVELRKSAEKVEQKRRNLNAAYIDPEIGMRKSDYLTQKDQLDAEMKGALSKIEAVEHELAQLAPTVEPQDLEAFSAQVSEAFKNRELTPEEKRDILKQLHVRVLVNAEGRIRIDGWVKTGWLSSTTR